MAVYRFRVFIEDDHEVYRDIEVLGKQRFADLHKAIVKSFSFKDAQAAEYVSSDHSWYDGDTIVKLDENMEGDHQKISSHIFDPHQRFLCFTASFKEVGLALELQKILKEEEGATYPRSVRSEGRPPFYTQPPPKPIIDEAEEEAAPTDNLNTTFDGDGPSEADIERFQKEAEAAGKAGELKAPEVDVKKLQQQSERKASSEEGFEEFDVDDLM